VKETLIYISAGGNLYIFLSHIGAVEAYTTIRKKNAQKKPKHVAIFTIISHSAKKLQVATNGIIHSS